jgi:cysteine desulfurase
MSVYLDHQATSPMPQAVKEAYLEAMSIAGNPSALHRGGRAARALMEDARERIATMVGAHPVEVVFTSGGTEAINTALKGSVWAHQREHGAEAPTAIASTLAEHHATLDVITWLHEQEATAWSEIAVDDAGVMDLESLDQVLGERKITVVSSLLANNEVGSIQPVPEIVDISSAHGVPVHVDAVAALGYQRLNFRDMGVESMSLSAHKVGGPVGVGALVLSRYALDIQALHHGGNQQRSRSGTMDAAGAVAFAVALEVRAAVREEGEHRLVALRDRLRAGLLNVAPQCVARGSLDHRLPGNLHLTVPGCKGDVLLYLLDEHGIHASTGSACQAGIPEPSHVLLAMGVPTDEAWGAIRLTLSYSTTEAEIDRVISVFSDVVERGVRAGLSKRTKA